ncbi:hypothetical protein E2I00_008194 [Balaenoptera physalus]|uniref:SEA domain-containing protein n=1 Tax=Balaenoptera physalus TaxID=9770 RepID=A0A6A1Q3L3_BALPH|nr:hypothetical protein E2I00_008194 [Balaenoptera physalus]
MPVWAEKPRKNGSRCQTPDLRGRTFGDKGQVWGQVSYLGTIIPGEEGQTAGSNLTDLALETISIRLTAMRPFQPPLLLPGSAPFVLLEKTILRQVTPVVSGFYTAHPQEDPLLLFSNADQWVGVYIEYKFQTPIGTHPPGLANHLAWNIVDPAVQKSSIMANAEKAEMVQYEVWLQILDQPFTKALRDKSGPKSQQLRGMLTRWVKWGRGERREEQEAGGFMCGDPTRLQYSCDPLHPLCSPADHRPQASAELRPSGGGEVPVRRGGSG